MRFVREFFTEETDEVAPDLLCCKMTLEHIGQTHQFLAICPRGRESQKFGCLFSGAGCPPHPEGGCVLGCLYEHCSYFSAISLKRLFTGSGFRGTEDLDRV